MNTFARLLRRGSAFKYQIAAWVSLTALGVIHLPAETFPTCHGVPHQCPRRSDRRRDLSIRRRETVMVLLSLPPLIRTLRDRVRSPRSIATFVEGEAVSRGPTLLRMRVPVEPLSILLRLFQLVCLTAKKHIPAGATSPLPHLTLD